VAYARYDHTCNWYIFWQSTRADEERRQAGDPKPKAEEDLAIWLMDHRVAGPTFTYAEVREMLESSDFGRIPVLRKPIAVSSWNACLSSFEMLMRSAALSNENA
jgi:hypothetical protein